MLKVPSTIMGIGGCNQMNSKQIIKHTYISEGRYLLEANTALLTRLRERKITQRQLASTIGLSESYISEVVNGRRNPSIVQKKEIAVVLHSTVKRLFPL